MQELKVMRGGIKINDVAHGVCGLGWNNNRKTGLLFFLQRVDCVSLRHMRISHRGKMLNTHLLHVDFPQ